jgi:hypothetical protein
VLRPTVRGRGVLVDGGGCCGRLGAALPFSIRHTSPLGCSGGSDEPLGRTFERLSLGGLSVTALGREQRYRSGTAKEASVYISIGAILLIILLILLIIFVF